MAVQLTRFRRPDPVVSLSGAGEAFVVLETRFSIAPVTGIMDSSTVVPSPSRISPLSSLLLCYAFVCYAAIYCKIIVIPTVFWKTWL